MQIYVAIYLLIILSIFLPRRFDNVTFPLTVIILLFMGCFRGINVGTDVLVYLKNFAPITSDARTWNVYTPFEPGYNFLMASMKEYITDSYYLFYGFVFFVTFLLLVFFIRKHSPRPQFSLFLLYTFCYYFASMNYMRQYFALAICLFLLCFYLKENGWRWFIFTAVVCVIAVLFHSSLIVFALLPLINYVFVDRQIHKSILYIGLIASVFFFFTKTYLISILLFAASLLSDRYSTYIQWGLYDQATYSSLEMLLLVTFCAFVIYLEKNTRSLFFYMYYISIVFRTSFITLVPMLGRIYFVYEIVSIVYFVQLYYSIERKYLRVTFGFAIILYGAILFARSLLNNANEVIPYTLSIF